MRFASVLPLSPLTLAWFLGACASGGKPQPAPTAPAPGVAAKPAVTAPSPAPGPTPTGPVVDTTVQPGRFDTGKMWTFENPPLEYFQREYGFAPSPDWLKRARLAALRLPN